MSISRLTIANQMLSLIGSIQPDPLSAAHVPDHSVQTTASNKARPRKAPAPEPIVEDIEIPDAAEDSDEEDTFQQLGRLGDEAAAREAAKKAKAEEEAKAQAEAKTEKKRKRKEAKESAGGADEDAQPEKKKKKKKTS